MTKAKIKNRKNLPVKYKVVADCIRVGKINAILLSDIMIIADIQDRRNAYIIIEELINKYGYVIGASKTGEYKGYFIPANDDEFSEVIHTFNQTIGSLNKRYENLLINYKEMKRKENSA